nr:5-formyltetrahydrofolate cyclo-ligase [Pedobacter panaciterrae]
MKKAELRKLALNQRKLLSPLTIPELSRQLLSHFSKLDFSEVKTIHVFLPIAEKNEPDTFLFIEWLKNNYPDIKIIVPKADFETALMNNYVYSGKEDLKKNLYNILEPQGGQLHSGDVDIVIVPLLAFDERGYRVGYGKGFYDRFLDGLETFKVGISFFESGDNIDDVNEHDIQLDLCITPHKVYDFRKSVTR